MEWGALTKTIANLGLPLLGQALGPVGGVAAGLIGDVLGLDEAQSQDPAKIQSAIEADPNAADKLKSLQERNRHQLETLALQGQIEQNRLTQQSYQAELASGDEYTRRWRPRLGRRITDIIVAIVIALIMVLVAGIIMLGILPNGPMLVERLTALVAEIGNEVMVIVGTAMTLLGVGVRARSKEKQVAAATAAGHPPAPGILASVISAIKK